MNAIVGTLEQPWQLAPDVLIAAAPDGSARLLHMGGDFHAISVIGALMLKLTLEHGEAHAVREIARQYDADEGQIRADLDAFLGELRGKRLLIRKDAARAGDGWTSSILRAQLWMVCHCLPIPKVRLFALLWLASFSFRWFGWGTTVAVWTRFFPQGTVTPDEASWISRARAIDEHVRHAAAGHLFRMECKERALCCWAMARRAGLPASLVVGIQFCPLAGHCWCESGPCVLSDDKEHCALYAPIIQFA